MIERELDLGAIRASSNLKHGTNQLYDFQESMDVC